SAGAFSRFRPVGASPEERRENVNVVTGPGVDAPTDAPYKLVAAHEHRRRSVVHAGDAPVGGGSEFMFIAGPCAVESAEQGAAACEAAVQAGATMLRGDLYKHRTSPYAFQGLGAAGVELIAAQRRRFDRPWVAEVLAPEHLEVVADVVDVVRVGARNMQNFEL